MQNETIQTPVNLLFAGVTQNELDKLKAEHEEVYILTVNVKPGEKLTGYFKRPTEKQEQENISLHLDNKIEEAGRFLLTSTFIAGDKALISNQKACLQDAGRLWTFIKLPKQ